MGCYVSFKLGGIILHKIIYVDDDVQIGKLVKDYLEMDQFEVTLFNSYNELKEINYSKYELMLLDIMLPDTNGIEICRKIRDRTSYPIIFLSALGMETNFVTALDSGGDDYITKPFSLKTLKAKINSHLRREERLHEQSNLIYSQNICLNKDNMTVAIFDNSIDFPKKEYLILEKLIGNKGQVLDKEQLFVSIWGYNSESDLATITEHIKRIRYKLSEFDSEYSYIQTKYGLGYYWEPKYEK